MKAVKCAKQLCLWLGIGLFALELAHKWSHRKDVPVCPKAHYVWHNKMCWPQAYVERQNYTPSPAPEWPQDVKKHKKPLRWLHWRYDVFRDKFYHLRKTKGARAALRTGHPGEATCTWRRHRRRPLELQPLTAPALMLEQSVPSVARDPMGVPRRCAPETCVTPGKAAGLRTARQMADCGSVQRAVAAATACAPCATTAAMAPGPAQKRRSVLRRTKGQ
ncbi:hypothetical protein JKP88DRAFT_313630 [Tribonema minus]|uniref:Uncharacterized protein n=1 Tax=Tribonema minus TaxID=303371 RepID=A0A835Z011_9STRA|nr:hypothetical protein JKP88DRAFT_313630 [Tribonema minus]